MGSDSRTATATSSKPRPSWRDRHLSQLSDEQLNDVKKYRAGTGSPDENVGDTAARQVSDKSLEQASADAALLAGIDGMETTAGQTEYSETYAPRRQAGPDCETMRDAGYERSDYRADVHRGGRARSEPGSKAGGQNRSRGEDREREYRTGQPHNREPERFRREDRQREDGYRENKRHAARSPEVRNGDRNEDIHRDVNRERESYRGGQDRREPSYRQDVRQGNVHRHKSEAPVARHPVGHGSGIGSKPALEQTVQGETPAQKSIVNRLLDFKLSGPVKYGLMALAIAAMIAVSLMKPIDNSSQSQLDSALTRAMIGFGLARTLNGVISVAQGTEFAVQPAGVGVNFSPGEILDPINDLVERFSWVMLLATSSLGVQKILLEVSSWAGISVLLGGAGLFFLLTRLRNSSMARMADIAGKLLLVMILVRFLIPVGSLANDWVYKQFLQPQYEQSSEQLEIASTRIREISARQTQAEENDGSLKERAKSLYNSMTAKFDFDGMLNDYKDSAENVSEHAISLIVVFTLQTIVFPLLFLYLIYRLFRSVLLPHRSSS